MNWSIICGVIMICILVYLKYRERKQHEFTLFLCKKYTNHSHLLEEIINRYCKNPLNLFKPNNEKNWFSKEELIKLNSIDDILVGDLVRIKTDKWCKNNIDNTSIGALTLTKSMINEQRNKTPKVLYISFGRVTLSNSIYTWDINWLEKLNPKYTYIPPKSVILISLRHMKNEI